MSEPVISVENLGKKYVIGHERAAKGRETFREMLLRNARGLARSAGQLAKGQQITRGDEIEEFWALDGVSFDVKHGEVLGIIGANGAGKSTLLKILSRITEPTRGRAVIAGRVASLLEVGTGFHAELTGRENIFLNGAILGMTRREVRARLDEIVDFAGVEKFIDTPVKRYSSGMSVRLAFSVAAYLEPEILIVDEVLAVGDAEFQKKCIGKMSSVASGGRTVLFVSHNMGAIATLCGRGLLLRAGRTAAIGAVGDVIAAYMASVNKMQRAEFVVDRGKPAIKAVEVDAAKLARGDLAVTIEFVSPQPISPIGGITLQSGGGFPVWGSNARFHETTSSISEVRSGVLTCEAPDIPLIDSVYTLSVWLGGPYEIYDHIPGALSFSIGRPNERGVRPPPDIIGNLDWRATWSAKE